ncbi:MAG: hypothetical protein SPJ34_08475, partial [Candidatus Ornithospirochaeta sp.]|nr:hypothetical protein [Candidatus Ornithospirochaeta sp.]
MKISKRNLGSTIGQLLAVIVTFFTHWVVFYFIVINSFKTKGEAARLNLSLPSKWQIAENYKYVLTYSKNLFLRSMWNSVKLTVVSIALLVLVSSMTGYILQRRQGILSRVSHKLILCGLIVPPSVIATYW